MPEEVGEKSSSTCKSLQPGEGNAGAPAQVIGYRQWGGVEKNRSLSDKSNCHPGIGGNSENGGGDAWGSTIVKRVDQVINGKR